jgi:hypothetical protein
VFALPGLILLLAVDYFKPQEYVPFLAGVPLLYAFTALTILGFVVDLRLGLSRLAATPQLVPAVLFVGWCLLTGALKGGGMVYRVMALLVPFSLYLLVAHVVQTFRAFQAVMAVVLAFGLSVAVIGVHQGFADWGCHRLEYEHGKRNEVYDGRPCSDGEKEICGEGDAEPGAAYVCERVGLFGTESINGRVRFRGTMEDPNELSLAVGITMPLAFAFFDRRRSALRLVMLAATIALAGLCAVFTKSRGGQLVFLVTLGVYFVHRLGRRGLVLAAVGALPVLVLAGRGRGDASASTLERLECWAAGMKMFWDSPVFGVGIWQFVEHHYLTAHSSFVLAVAELGIPGMFLWSVVVYLSFKIPVQALRDGRSGAPGALAPAALSWSLALLAALAGMLAGMMLLSYVFKELFWIYVGLSGALYQAIRRHVPSFRVAFGGRDLARVVAVDAALLAATAAYTRLTLGY